MDAQQLAKIAYDHLEYVGENDSKGRRANIVVTKNGSPDWLTDLIYESQRSMDGLCAGPRKHRSMKRSEPKRCQLCGATGVLQRVGSQLVCVRLSCQDEARCAMRDTPFPIPRMYRD